MIVQRRARGAPGSRGRKGEPMTSLGPPPPRPTAAECERDPAAMDRWMDDYWSHCLLEGLHEADEEERERARRRILAALVRRVKRGPYLVCSRPTE